MGTNTFSLLIYNTQYKTPSLYRHLLTKLFFGDRWRWQHIEGEIYISTTWIVEKSTLYLMAISEVKRIKKGWYNEGTLNIQHNHLGNHFFLGSKHGFQHFVVYQCFTIYRWYFVLKFDNFHVYLIQYSGKTILNG
jgi:hypothetical protein